MQESTPVLWDRIRSFEQFHAAYQRERGGLNAAGKGEVLAEVATLVDPAVRTACMGEVLDDSPDVSVLITGRNTALHCMMGAVDHDLAAEAVIMRRVLDAGGDLNADNARRENPMSLILRRMTFSESELEPIYEVAFAWAREKVREGDFPGLSGGGFRPGRRPIWEARQAELQRENGTTHEQ